MKSTRRSILAALTALIPAAWLPRKPPVTASARITGAAMTINGAEIPAGYIQVMTTPTADPPGRSNPTYTFTLEGTDNLGNRFEIPSSILSGEDAELSIGAVDGAGRIKVFR